jgi:hypothetical protein
MNFSRAVTFHRRLAMYPVNDAGSIARPHRSSPSADISSIHQFIRLKEVSIMKTLYKLALSLGLTAMGLFGLQSAAMATAVNASVCKPLSSNQAGLQSAHNGVFNASGAFMSVVCPLARMGAASARGWQVTVNGHITESQHINCTLSSTDVLGGFLGNTSFTFFNVPGGNGIVQKALLLPQSVVFAGSTQAIVCDLPPNGQLFVLNTDL